MKRVVRLRLHDGGTLYLDLNVVESIAVSGSGHTLVGVPGIAGYVVHEDAEALRALWMDNHVVLTVPGREAVYA